MTDKISIFWHRRDLRIHDNAGLYQALKFDHPVLSLFIFDKNILDKLSSKDDKRVLFIHNTLLKVKEQLKDLGSDILIKYGKPDKVWKEILSKYPVAAVFTNRDYEPYAQERDKKLYEYFQKNKIEFKGFKDQVFFEKNEVLKKDGLPYTVFTPYSRKWKEKCNDFYLKAYPNEEYQANYLKISDPLPYPSLDKMGFKKSDITFPTQDFNLEIIQNYAETRDIPSINGTSRLSIHLRFGTVSIRKLAQVALQKNEKFLNELIWRDFYQMILFHFPHSVEKSFKPAYENIPWSNNEEHFKAWCEGKTGYPIVDAGMRELNETGFMHNRVRMVTASFLTKHLLIDWKWGERYFAEKLLDFDLASNIGGWQWAASSGCDAAPYFRVFNPTLQMEKFDKERKYIKHWVPEFGTDDYPTPIVEHKIARQKAIDTYKIVLEKYKAGNIS